MLDGCLSDRGCHVGMGTIASTVPTSQLNPHSFCLYNNYYLPCLPPSVSAGRATLATRIITIVLTYYYSYHHISYFIWYSYLRKRLAAMLKSSKPMRAVYAQFPRNLCSKSRGHGDSTSSGNANRYPLTCRSTSIGLEACQAEI